MIYSTIDTITRELQQLNQSGHELGLIDDMDYAGHIERLDTINKYYYGKKQVKELERLYLDLKVYETILLAQEALDKK